MKKITVGIPFVFFALLIAGAVVADDQDHNETAEHEVDFSVCLSAVFLLLVVIIAISVVILASSRFGSKP
ncbi:MAG: hypothetical protein ACE5KV_01345 [Thermoplasmata archaeon]